MLRNCLTKYSRNFLPRNKLSLLKKNRFSTSTCQYDEAHDDTQEQPKITEIPLNKELKRLPKPIYADVDSRNEKTKVTTLENGLRVATEEIYGNFSTIGVLIDSGSRYEAAYPSGISHFLEKLSFGDTVEMKGEKIVKEFQDLNSIIDCQSSRDALIYATSVEKKSTARAVEILGEVTLRPLITDTEVVFAQKSVQFDLDMLSRSPDKDKTVVEYIHSAAYSNNTLGLPKICPKDNIEKMNRDMIFSYMKHHHTPDRMVLAGVGVDHDQLVEFANKYFVEKKPIWDEDKTIKIHPKSQRDTSFAQYTGGVRTEQEDLSNVSNGPNPLPHYVHMAMGLESVGHQHPDFVTMCLLQFLMGGGGSFSAGGPGKGMYTRLYRNVLNRCHWVNAATAFNLAYEDTGLFYIQAASHPSYLRDLVQVITREIVRMAGDLKTEEFKRAKVQLQSMVLMNLESRPVIFEDLGRQVLSTGKKKTAEEYVQLIKSVTEDDLIRVAGELIKRKPSVVGYGSLDKMPSLKDIESGLLDRYGDLPFSVHSIFTNISA